MKLELIETRTDRDARHLSFLFILFICTHTHTLLSAQCSYTHTTKRTFTEIKSNITCANIFFWQEKIVNYLNKNKEETIYTGMSVCVNVRGVYEFCMYNDMPTTTMTETEKRKKKTDKRRWAANLNLCRFPWWDGDKHWSSHYLLLNFYYWRHVNTLYIFTLRFLFKFRADVRWCTFSLVLAISWRYRSHRTDPQLELKFELI